MSIVLIGYRGSGKTTIGRRLAEKLWQPAVDADELIVRRAAKSIRDIFEQDGEDAFRDMETQILRDSCLLKEHVISLGGGALKREQNRAILKASAHKVIYLRCEPQELFKRITADPATAAGRPSLTSLGGSLDEVTSLLAEREPIYRQAMSAELDVTHLSPDEAVAAILKML